MAACPPKSHTDINERDGNSIDHRNTIEESESYFAFQAYTCDDEKKVPYAGRLMKDVDMKREGAVIRRTHVYNDALSMMTARTC